MADSRDLAGLDDVKRWLNLSSGAEDDLLARLVTAASVAIETALGRKVAVADYEERRDGTGGRTLAFAATPVASVASVEIDGRAIPAAPGGTGPGYLFTPTRLSLFGYRFAPGLGNVSLAYRAGFDPVPPDLGQACIELVALRYRERDRIGLVSKGLAGESTSFTQAEMPDGVKAVVQRYRRVVPV